jgi:hypothetical protein
MPTKKFIYKRGTGKNQVHIEGEYADSKRHVLFDQILRLLPWIFALLCLFVCPKVALLGPVWDWVKRKISFFTLFVAVISSGLLLSG